MRAALFRHNEILLVREREDGRWSLPGGWADVGESPSQVAVREIMEESGYNARAVRLLAVLDRDQRGNPAAPFHVYKIFLQCDLLNEIQTQPGVQRGRILPGRETARAFLVPSDRSGNRADVCSPARSLVAGGL